MNATEERQVYRMIQKKSEKFLSLLIWIIPMRSMHEPDKEDVSKSLKIHAGLFFSLPVFIIGLFYLRLSEASSSDAI